MWSLQLNGCCNGKPAWIGLYEGQIGEKGVFKVVQSSTFIDHSREAMLAYTLPHKDMLACFRLFIVLLKFKNIRKEHLPPSRNCFMF